MAKLFNKIILSLTALSLTGCAGFSRGFTKAMNTSFGADYLVVKYNFQGDPYRCWELKDVSLVNEQDSDGIYWEHDYGNLVHINGLDYDFVQVNGGNFAKAHAQLGFYKSKLKCVGN